MQRQLAARLEAALAAFVERPSKAAFLAARDAVLHESSALLAAGQLAELERLLDQEDYHQLISQLDALPPSKVLSPRIHLLAAEAADAVGNRAETELERCLFVITLRGLLATGNGTQADPYLVCHISDENDVLEALEREASHRATVENAGRFYDVVRCSDGREMWFDVTDVLQPPALKRVRRSSPRRRRRPSRVGR